MTIQDYILTYKRTDENGKEYIVANIPDYYDTYVINFDPKFKSRSLRASRTVICPVHDDNDPSFGLMRHRHLPGVMLYHCFGCNSTGTIIRLHQRIREKYDGIKLNEQKACEEIAHIFQIPLDEFNEDDEEDYNVKYMRMQRKITELTKSYTSKDFSDEILKLRKESEIVDLNKLNKASIKMIATTKHLYE